MDYLRWRTRRTEADRAVRARVEQLIHGEKTHVRRLVERPPGADPLGAQAATADRDLAGDLPP